MHRQNLLNSIRESCPKQMSRVSRNLFQSCCAGNAIFKWVIRISKYTFIDSRLKWAHFIRFGYYILCFQRRNISTPPSDLQNPKQAERGLLPLNSSPVQPCTSLTLRGRKRSNCKPKRRLFFETNRRDGDQTAPANITNFLVYDHSRVH